MKVKESLVYDKHEAQIVGNVDLGNVNDQLDKFEREIGDVVEPLTTSWPSWFVGFSFT